MRELKFRVWSEEDKQYRTDCKLRYLFTSPTGLPSTVYNDEGDRFDIEQYTGLKDKNGEEIYEGDIVEEDIDFNSKMTDGTFRYGVYWDECSLCWALDPIGEEGIHNELWQTNLSRRVVGNIHENGDLLGDTNVTNKEEEK